MLKFIQKKKLLSSIFLFLLVFGFSNGEIYIRMLDGDKIKEIEIENYLYGVLSKEMGDRFPLEALKAQAVVSRTYALWKKITNKNNGYDVENSIYNQVFGYCYSEKIKKAVDETKGEILATSDGSIIPVFFHANSGGMTTNPADVWSGNYPYDFSTIDPYSEESPYYKWKKIIPKKYLSKIFGAEIDKIEVIERDKTNRAKFLKFITKDGKIIILKGNDFRIKLNGNTRVYFENPYIIPSTMFYVIEDGENFIFEGKGYGHGVGLSQDGAKKMAESGFNYVEILKFYFKDLELYKLDVKRE